MEDFYQHIQAYIDGDLSASEMIAFDEALRNDPKLAGEVDLQRKILENLADPNAYAFWQIVQEQENKHRAIDKNKTRQIRLFSRVAAVAAAVLLLLIAGYFLLNNKPRSAEQLFTAYFSPPDPVLRVDRDVHPNDSTSNSFCAGILQKADTLFQKKKFGDALKILRSALPAVEKGDCGNYFNYYIGIAQLGTNEPENAIISFGKVAQNAQFFDKVQWYIALAFLKISANDPSYKEEASRAFEGIKNGTGGNAQKKQAGEILDNLK